MSHYFGAVRVVVRRDVVAAIRRPGEIVGDFFLPAVFFLALTAGFGDFFGLFLIEPYDTYTPFAEYLVPGLVGLVLLMRGFRAALKAVEGGPGSIQQLMTAPIPLWLIVIAKLAGPALIASTEACLILAVAAFAGSYFSAAQWIGTIATILLAAFTLAAVALLLVLCVKTLRRMSSMLVYVMLPAFLFSSALYPFWTSAGHAVAYLYTIAQANPFTHAVELIRHASVGHFGMVALAVTVGIGLFAAALAIALISPKWRLLPRAGPELR